MNQKEIVTYAKEHGTIPHYAWPGGYPLEYVTNDGSILCPECTEQIVKDWLTQGETDYSDLDDDTIDALYDKVDLFRYKSDLPTMCAPYYEGPTMFCNECNAEIGSAYGDPFSND